MKEESPSLNHYIVQVREVYISHIFVKAEDEGQAFEKVNAFGTDAGHEILSEFSHTLDTDTWTVEEADDDILHLSGGRCTDRGCNKCFPPT
jgi:hypothetical protein